MDQHEGGASDGAPGNRAATDEEALPGPATESSGPEDTGQRAEPGANPHPDHDGIERTSAPSWRQWRSLAGNPATIKGAALVGVGGIALLLPSLSIEVLTAAVAVGLIVVGLVDVWRAIRGSAPRRGHSLIVGLAALAAGGLMVTWAEQTLESVVSLMGIYIGSRGVVSIVRILLRRSPNVVLDIISGGVETSLGILMFLLPEAIIQALVGAGAIAAILIGAVIIRYSVQSGRPETDIDRSALRMIAVDWLRGSDIGDDRRAEIADGLYMEEPFRLYKLAAWWVMLLLSVAIATYGVLQDSTAVVIGAMLIAPLMTPIIGASAAIVNGRRVRLVSSLALVWGGVAGGIVLAYVIGKWNPSMIPLDANSQVTSRTNPNITDMAIALAAGAAGAFAMVNRRVASGIAGVAIAVALVPPLAVVGLTLESSEFAQSWGAFLLFLTNFVSILLSATAVFVVTGWTSVSRLKSEAVNISITMGVVMSAAMVILLPLLFTSEGLLTSYANEATATTTTRDWFSKNAPELTVNRVEVDGDTLLVSVTGATPVPDLAPLSEELSSGGSSIAVQATLIPTAIYSYEPGGQTTVTDPLSRDGSTRPISGEEPSASSSQEPEASGEDEGTAGGSGHIPSKTPSPSPSPSPSS